MRHLQVPGADIRSSSRVRRVGNVVIYKVANMVTPIEAVRELINLIRRGDIIRLYFRKNASKRNHVSPAITQSTDSDRLRGEVSIQDELRDRAVELSRQFASTRLLCDNIQLKASVRATHLADAACF